MDLTALLLRVAARRPNVLVVPVPGHAPVRLAVEAAVARRGWPTATGAADADVLAVAGSPGPELAAVIERIWRQVPAPRVRAVVAESADADRELDRAAKVLADRNRQGARAHASGGDAAAGPPGDGHSDHGHGSAGSGNRGHHGGHHGHGGGMAMPGGLPMADLGEDRDGLTLDRLHVALGPVLPDWPAGLVVRVTLQGDVIQEAGVELLDADFGAGHSALWWTGHGAVRELDGLARFLGVVGWADAAARSRRLRDTLLSGDAPERVAAPAAALVRRVRRSRTLRWLVRGIPAGPVDVAGLLDERLDTIDSAVGSAGASSVAAPAPRPGVDELAALLVGAELAAARLIVAAVDPDPELTAVGQARRG